jgi:integrase
VSELSVHVDDYLRLRRGLGYKLAAESRLLGQLVAYLEDAGAATLTVELAVAWARLPATAQTCHWAKRLSVARKFALYLKTVDPTAEVPPTGVFPGRPRRRTPYAWSDDDVAKVLEGARGLRPGLRAATHETLFGLLAATGMRLGEAIGLGRDDVDLGSGVITIHHAKFDRSRLVPLHHSATAALARYVDERDRLCPQKAPPTFFVSRTGSPLTRSGVDLVFREITTSVGLRTATVQPHVHDLRHGFAVACLISWQRSGVSIDAHMATLSAYLGHVRPEDTYWYLSAAPELMLLAARRLDDRYGAQR